MIRTKWRNGLLLALLTLPLIPSVSAEPLVTQRLTMTIELYETAEEVSAVCREHGASTAALGCVYYHLRQGRTLVLRKPRDWCDWSTIKTWGHELMHAFGWSHKGFEWQWKKGGEWPMEGTNCELHP